MFPTTALDEVLSPVKESVGVAPPDDWIGNVPVTEVTALAVKPLSLLNHESFTDDEAIDCVSPLVPVKRNPWPRFERKRLLLNVEEAVEKIPFENPIVVEVEL
jgi:hypothetical protein